jgi:hypothetical protein
MISYGPSFVPTGNIINRLEATARHRFDIHRDLAAIARL